MQLIRAKRLVVALLAALLSAGPVEVGAGESCKCCAEWRYYNCKQTTPDSQLTCDKECIRWGTGTKTIVGCVNCS